jgi:hypothetical protein
VEQIGAQWPVPLLLGSARLSPARLGDHTIWDPRKGYRCDSTYNTITSARLRRSAVRRAPEARPIGTDKCTRKNWEYVYTYYIYIHIHHMYILYMYVYIYIYTYVYIYILLKIFQQICVLCILYLCICMYVCVYIYIHITISKTEIWWMMMGDSMTANKHRWWSMTMVDDTVNDAVIPRWWKMQTMVNFDAPNMKWQNTKRWPTSGKGWQTFMQMSAMFWDWLKVIDPPKKNLDENSKKIEKWNYTKIDTLW